MEKLERVLLNMAVSGGFVSALISDLPPEARYHGYWFSDALIAAMFAVFALVAALGREAA